MRQHTQWYTYIHVAYVSIRQHTFSLSERECERERERASERERERERAREKERERERERERREREREKREREREKTWTAGTQAVVREATVENAIVLPARYSYLKSPHTLV